MSRKGNEMRCNICDAGLSEPDYNADLAAYEPCPTCLAIALEAAGAFTDKPSAGEDDLPDEDLAYLLYSTRIDGEEPDPEAEDGEDDDG